jgi:hypothetical protein
VLWVDGHVSSVTARDPNPLNQTIYEGRALGVVSDEPDYWDGR